MFLSELQKLEKQYVAQTYKRFDLGVESGSGAVCTDVSGRQYIDFSSGIGVNSIGFCNPKWAAAVKHQIDTLAHMSNLYYTQPMIQLAKALCERTGMKRVFFGNSGAEANEGAIKTARRYGEAAGRHEIVCLHNSFHGRTIATLAATGQDQFHAHFGPFPDGFVFARANDAEDLRAKITEKTCAVLIELIQGEGGVVPLTRELVEAVKTACAEKDLLLMVDEVQTGVGRTGKFLCCGHYGLRPDVVTLAKGLGGGLPIGAVLFGEKTMNTLGFGDHASTFGGNPVVSAGALAVLEAMDGKFLDEVCEKGEYLTRKLEELDGVTGVTGKGLMLGASLEVPLVACDVAAACAAAGLVVLTAKEKIRLLPPLTITTGEIDAGLKILSNVLCECKEKANETPVENA